MIADFENRSVAASTLAQRLAEGPLPAELAFRYATLLGQALRDLHDKGKCHGAISPRTILLTAEGLELTSPAEVCGVPDFAADISAFGRMLAEMLGEPAGSPGSDAHGAGTLIAACVSSDPNVRPPNMQKALLELKVVVLSARHTGAKTTARADAEAALHAELQRVEGRVAELEASVADTIRQCETRFSDAVSRIQSEMNAQTSVLESVHRSMSQTDDLIGRVVETFESKLGAMQAQGADNAARLETIERSLRAAADQNAKLEARLAEEIRQVQTDAQAHAAVTESVRQSMAYTDNLVGRVVEAMETIVDLNTVRS